MTRTFRSGYTLLELLVTLSILGVLTSISFISIAAPLGLLKKESQISHLSNLFQLSQLHSLLTGESTQLSFTPWVLWINDRKALEFSKDSPWQWQTTINTVQIQPDGNLQITTSEGKTSLLPQQAILTYNQEGVAWVDLNPTQGTIRIMHHAQ